MRINFNPRTSCEVRRFNDSIVSFQGKISIHAPRVRCDRLKRAKFKFLHNFNPRTSCEVRRDCVRTEDGTGGNFNPRTSCEVRQKSYTAYGFIKAISIHAPRVRCDITNFAMIHDSYDFNPRTSCEVRQKHSSKGVSQGIFQSTHLV